MHTGMNPPTRRPRHVDGGRSRSGFGHHLEERKKESPTRGHAEDIGSAVDIYSYEGQGYEGVMSGKCIATSRHPHLYVMAVHNGAGVVRVL